MNSFKLRLKCREFLKAFALHSEQDVDDLANFVYDILEAEKERYEADSESAASAAYDEGYEAGYDNGFDNGQSEAEVREFTSQDVLDASDKAAGYEGDRTYNNLTEHIQRYYDRFAANLNEKLQ